MFWCPRCGTLTEESGDYRNAEVPTAMNLARAAVAMDDIGGRLAWLKCLIGEFEERSKALEDYTHEAHGEPYDEDPSATAEMLMECKMLLNGLQAAFPRPPVEAAPAPKDDPEIPF